MPPTDTRPPSPVAHGKTAVAIMIACAMCASVFVALLPLLVVPHFADMFLNFGAELPMLTRLLVDHPFVFWAVPVLTLLIWRLWPDRSRGALFALLFAIASVPALTLLLVFALYLPIFQLGASVG